MGVVDEVVRDDDAFAVQVDALGGIFDVVAEDAGEIARPPEPLPGWRCPVAIVVGCSPRPRACWLICGPFRVLFDEVAELVISPFSARLGRKFSSITGCLDERARAVGTMMPVPSVHRKA